MRHLIKPIQTPNVSAGVTIGINQGFSAALGVSDTEVEACLGRGRTGLRKYGISDARPFKSILRKTVHRQAETAQRKRLACNLFYEVRI